MYENNFPTFTLEFMIHVDTYSIHGAFDEPLGILSSKKSIDF